MLHNTQDPTTALFISEGAASKAASMVLKRYPKRVFKAVPRLHKRRGECLGYEVQLWFTDTTPPSPLTNSDFERLVP